MLSRGGDINGNDGNDTVHIFSDTAPINDSNIFGGKGDDSIYVEVEDLSGTLVSGDLGNDSIYVYSHLFNSSVFGADGNDTIHIYGDLFQNTDINGNQFNDSIFIYGTVEDTASVHGGQGNDSIWVKKSDSGYVNGNNGNDSIFVYRNSGSVYGGQGLDNIEVGDAKLLAIQEGAIFGNLGADTLTGGTFSADAFTYSFGDTALIGTAGFDSINDFVSSNILTFLYNDSIDLTSGDIVFDIAGLSGGITIDGDAVITGGVDNLSQFIAAGSGLTTEGAAIGISIDAGDFVFISNGNGVQDTDDLLIAFNKKVDGLTFDGGDIIAIS
ncbi:hypothetical protein KQ304_07690 [Synechococcus sp. CS-1329]|uniref:calcium-binding protein n=1 Tax=Synechococcus sp. CS-1329 TaxID=2847975 RepID=UPI00223C2143|nr:hypothetical protein [Synechococcus sp. CS-1329]MCT0218880.1 hypothetical protein [Synechococcus sp. CS-1329]